MKKRLIICCDGTWNEPDKNPTNVVKLVRAIKPTDSAGIHQVVFYDQGVGTLGGADRFLGGAFGKGVRRNILEAYRFLVHNYNQEDEIYCFGFSRGAYTARALVGMLNATGLIEKDELSELPEVYKYYRTEPHKRLGKKYIDNYRPKVTMVGVWDTVGALGAPTPILGRFTKPMVSFFDTRLSPYVKNAFHALAIDEHRGPFKPDLWTGTINSDQTVEQVWFAGVHSDIGGGYRETGLSDISLKWMMEKSELLGLEFDSNLVDNPFFLQPELTQPIHDSYSMGYKLLNYIGAEKYVRSLIGDDGDVPINVSIHPSVYQKCQRDSSYKPENLSTFTQVKDQPIALDDKRRHLRHKTKVQQATLETPQGATNCQVVDFSPIGGARVKGTLDVHENDSVALSSKYFAKTIGKVAWKNGEEFGVKFVS